MSKKQLRYRVGIDVGLNSVGCSAIQISDEGDVYDATPIKLLSTVSYIHDGGVPSWAAKQANSRKLEAGVARRTRRRMKARRERLNNLDNALKELGFPVDIAIEFSQGVGNADPYFAWNMRIKAAQQFIENDTKRLLAVTVAVRHIARHRGWRNPYNSVSSVIESSNIGSRFYLEFVERVALFRFRNSLPAIPGVSIVVNEKGARVAEWSDKGAFQINANRPTPAQLVEDLLSPGFDHRIVAERSIKGNLDQFNVTSESQLGAHMGKLHQSDYCFELKKIFETQQISEDVEDQLFKLVFAQKNPREVGAAAKLVGRDAINPAKFRATRASIAFEKYRIVTTLQNLRISDGRSKRPLQLNELKECYDFLVEAEDPIWVDLAEVLDIEPFNLKGVGGITADGEPISVKVPPVLRTERELFSNSTVKKMPEIKLWWKSASSLDKEMFIESLSNAGVPEDSLDDDETIALENVNALFELLGEKYPEPFEKLFDVQLTPGRVAYSVDTLMRLTEYMLENNVDLVTARRDVYGLPENWRPEAEKLGMPTGNPAVDRTIKYVARWLKACEARWGVPATVNIEHMRDGFISPKKKRELNTENDRRYRANQELIDEARADLEELLELDNTGRIDLLRYRALQRQNNQCAYCGAKIDYVTAQMDHIVPRQSNMGSSNDRANLVATCAECNKSKSNTLFTRWANSERQKATKERVASWTKDANMSPREWNKFKKEILTRLSQTEEDEPLDERSTESVAWMARNLASQVRGHFNDSKLKVKIRPVRYVCIVDPLQLKLVENLVSRKDFLGMVSQAKRIV